MLFGSARRADVVAIVVLLLGTLLAYSDVLGPTRVLAFRDHTLVFHPALWAATRELLGGHWPVVPAGAWTLPLETTTNLALYTPATAWFAVLPFHVAYDIFVWSHTLLLGLGVYVFARIEGRASPAALVTAAICALAGPVLSFENLVVGLQGMAWAPWVTLLAVRVARRPSARALAGLALVAAFELQAALPEVVLIQAVVYFAVLGRGGSTRGWLAVGAAVPLAGLLAAVDLGPLLEALANSRRGSGFSLEERSGWALDAGSLIELFVPNFVAPLELVAVHIPTSPALPPEPPYLVSLYLGVGLTLALTAPFTRRAVWVWAALALGVVLAFGAATPLFGWVTSLPVLSSSRYAIKYLLGSVVALAWLAGAAVATSRGGRLVAVAAFMVVLAASAKGVVGSEEFLGWLRDVARPMRGGAMFEAFRTSDLALSMHDAMSSRVDHVAWVSGCLLAWAAWAWWRSATNAAWGFALVLVLDLGAAGRVHILGAPRLQDDEAHAQLLDALSPATRVYVALPPPIVDEPGRTPFEAYVTTRERYAVSDYEHVRRYEPADLDGMASRLETRAFEAMERAPWPVARRLLERAGVDRVTTRTPLADVPRVAQIDTLGLEVYALPGARSYVSTSTEVRWVADAEQALRAMTELPPSVAVMVGPTPEVSQPQGCVAVQPTVVVERWRARVRSTSTCGYALIVREAWTPRWGAEIDGTPAEVRVADQAYVGLWVPAGEHTVSIAFMPASASWAWWSGLGVVLVGLLLVLRRRSVDRGPAVVDRA